MNTEKIKAIAEGMGLKSMIVYDGWGYSLNFNPYKYSSHTFMVLEWLLKHYEYEVAGLASGNVEISVFRVSPKTRNSIHVCIVEGSTLQEAICEAAYQVIKGE